MAKEVTKPPTGLKITRTGNKFTASWKIGDKDYGDSQHFQYLINDTGKDNWLPKKNTEIGHKTTSKVITTIDKKDYYPNVDKKGNNKPFLYTIGFRVKGNRKKYTTGSGKKKKNHNPSPCDWTPKEFTVNPPKKPTLTVALDEELTNVCTFSWSAPYADDDSRIFTDVQWQTILVKNSSETDGSKLSWKGTTFQEGTGGADSDKTITEDTAILYQNGNSYTRWFRVRSRGPRGVYNDDKSNGWVYKKHVYALSHQANVTGTSASETTNGGFQCTVNWTVGQSGGQNPIDKTTAQYTITIPDEGLTCPSGVSWNDANISRDTTDGDAAVFSIDDQLGKDQCLFIRVNTQHDSNITYGKPQLSSVGFLKDPSGLSVSTDNVTHKATIRATNASDVEDSILIVRYVPSSGDPIDIGVIPHGSSSVTVQCPNWDDQEAIAFDVYAIVGTAVKQQRDDGVDSYSVTVRMRSQNTISEGGAVPVAPKEVAVNRVEGKPDTVRVDWDWPWSDAGSAEISWSDHDDAWESTDEPESFLISNLHASHWNISGLETGKTWYIRVRLIAGDMTNTEDVTYGPWSDISQGTIDLSSAPNKPTLLLSNSVIPEDGSTIASWVYTTTDNTAQAYAEVAIVENGEYTPIAHSLTSQHVTIPAQSENYTLSTGNIYNLVCRVKSASGKLSEWSEIVSLTVAEPITCEITQTSLIHDHRETNPREFEGEGSVEFETEISEDFAKLQLSLEPKQDGTPWIGTDHDTTPYLNRAMPTQSNDYNRESGVIVGGTVSWNQLVPNVNKPDYTTGGVTFTVLSDGRISVSGTAEKNLNYQYGRVDYLANHVYIALGIPSSASSTGHFATVVGAVNVSDTIKKFNNNDYWTVSIKLKVGTTVSNVIYSLMAIDLTAMFGSTIADYIYSLEQATAGAGVAWFRRYFPEDYYPYSANALQSVQTTAHKTYDSGGNVIGNYALDSSLTLRGIPKLDASNNLYYDGDTYESDGTVTRKYGIVDLGTLNWTYSSSVFYANISGAKKAGGTVVQKYANKGVMEWNDMVASSEDKIFANCSVSAANHYVMVKDSSYTDAASFKTATSGVYLVYELATPTEEAAAPYTNPQIVDPDGTEEYVTANYVPVGHDSTYSLVCPISGYDEVRANVVGKNLWGGEKLADDIVAKVDGAVKDTTNKTVSYSASKITGVTLFTDFKPNTRYTIIIKQASSSNSPNIRFLHTDGSYLGIGEGATTSIEGKSVKAIVGIWAIGAGILEYEYCGLFEGVITTDQFEPYQGQTYTADLGQTVYGGTVDLVTGVLTVDRLVITRNTANMNNNEEYPGWKDAIFNEYFGNGRNVLVNEPLNIGESYGVNTVAAIGAIWLPINTYGKTQSEWIALAQDIQITIPLATPQTIQLTPQEIQTLVGYNRVWSEDEEQHIEIRIAESMWDGNVLTEMPLEVTVTGAGEGGITSILVERAEDYLMERPDETNFHGNRGDIVLQTSPPLVGTNQVSFGVENLIGALDDGAAYNIVATIQDGLGQTDDAILPFEVHWEHQAEEPSAEIEIDEENLIALITPIAPENADPEDVADIYRLSADRPELIVEGAIFGETYVDPYPALGDMGGHRIVTRTKNGDYITEDNQFAMVDSPELGVNPIENEDLLNIIDFEGRQIQFYWETNYSNTWAKDFQETQYLGGSIEGDWNPAVSRSGTLSSKAITVLDQEMLKDVRRLADYPGICHVRTADGSSYAADVQVSEDYTDDEKGMVTNYSLSITKVDPQGFEGMTREQWEEENPPEEEEEP